MSCDSDGQGRLAVYPGNTSSEVNRWPTSGRRSAGYGSPRAKGGQQARFVKTGAVAGVGVAAGVGATGPSTSGTALSQAPPPTPFDGHYEADIVIIGAGCTGLPAAIRARDLGASVIVVDQNFDPGGKMLHSGSQVSLGGGDPLQLRDIAGESDKEGFITAPPAATGRGTDRGSGLPVQGPHRLVGHGYRGPGPLPLQRTRPPSRLCRQLLRHQGIPDGELRPHGAHIRHARQWRHVARQTRGLLPHGRRHDGHQGGNRLEQDAGVDGVRSSHFAPRLMGDGATVAPGRAHERRGARQAAGVQRP